MTERQLRAPAIWRLILSIDHSAYYRKRAVIERARALKEDRADVAEIHAELARLYQALVDNNVLRPELHVAEDRDEPQS